MPVAGTAAGRPRGAAWAAWLATGAGMLAGALVLRAWNPGDADSGAICLLRRLTHHECATCGLTRSFAHLARGEFAAAFARHPLGPPLAAELVLLWLLAPIAILRDWRPSGTLRDRWLLAHAGAFLVLWAVRLVR